MEKLHIAILIGTTREQRKSVLAAEFMQKVADTYEDVTTELIDPKKLYI